ncbi:MAG: ABC transporter permease [Bacteroidales bacterium]|nr:ABC transporter permease [Bacteroidales bacterium]
MDLWNEILEALKKNKLRTFLTGFSVAWGIFMLIVLLGAGNGLKNGVMQNFEGESTNAVFMWPGTTTKTFEGLQKGRNIKFTDADLFLLQNQMPNIDKAVAVININNTTLSHGKEYGSYTLKGVNESYISIENIKMVPGFGRFINQLDLNENRKVMIISKRMSEVLFKDINPVGQYINAGKIVYQVVGVYTSKRAEDSRDGLIPFSTAQSIYNFEKDGYGNLEITVSGLTTEKENKDYEQLIRNRMGRLHSFDPTDNRALWIWNKLQSFMQTMGIFNAINLFLWIIGIGTLIAGIVGVSNIMLITVKERTKEFGIRKAIGASPLSILKLIVLESILITSSFGYMGMSAGILLTEGINYAIVQNTPPDAEMSIFANPTVDIDIAIYATLLLILAGVLAGYFPAKKAVSIKPIEALHYE